MEPPPRTPVFLRRMSAGHHISEWRAALRRLSQGSPRPHLHEEDASGPGLRHHFAHFRSVYAHGLLAQDSLARCQAQQHHGLVLGVLGANVSHL